MPALTRDTASGADRGRGLEKEARWYLRVPPPRRKKGGEMIVDEAKKAYKRPQLEVFGTVAELTLNACSQPGGDNKSCRDLAGVEGTTPGPGAGRGT